MMIKTTAMMMMIRMIFMALKYGFQNWFCCSCHYWYYVVVVVNGSPLLTWPWKCKMNELLVQISKSSTLIWFLYSYNRLIGNQLSHIIMRVTCRMINYIKCISSSMFFQKFYSSFYTKVEGLIKNSYFLIHFTLNNLGGNIGCNFHQ